ncbi:MAG: magnesium transporter [Clostridia bacterium]|jgi:magnesium transporter|nr:magnesium transporter [Clostridiales bacterium]MDK2984971.1 magnesium transporter [Clostridia bacterium]
MYPDVELNEIQNLLSQGKQDEVKGRLQELQPADIAEIIIDIEDEYKAIIFSLLDGETAAEVLINLDSDIMVLLLEKLGAERIRHIFDEMSSDDAADLIAEIPVPLKDKLLTSMEIEDANDVKELLAYKEDTAGGIMTTEYVAILKSLTAARAIEVLREIAPDAETVYYVYVVNEKNHLVGVLSLRELIVADPSTRVEDIMKENVISVHVGMDQEEVANVVSKYDFLAVPVVDDNNCLLGIITVDDIIDVIHEEATEDFYLLGGTSSELIEDEGLFNRIISSLRSRLPWLFITLLGGLLAGQVIKGLEEELSTVVALAFFIPLLTGMGGNVGTQSSTLTVRGLATGQIDVKEILLVVGRETLTGVLIGLICGIIVAIVAYLWQQNIMLGVVVGLALLGNMTTAATMGTLVPLIFKKVGIDPAVASAPFISTSIDITGLLIYSTVASLLMSYLM